MTRTGYCCRGRLTAGTAPRWPSRWPGCPWSLCPAAGSASEEGCEFLLVVQPFACHSLGPCGSQGSDLLRLTHPLILPASDSLIASTWRQPLWIRVCADMPGWYGIFPWLLASTKALVSLSGHLLPKCTFASCFHPSCYLLLLGPVSSLCKRLLSSGISWVLHVRRHGSSKSLLSWALPR